MMGALMIPFHSFSQEKVSPLSSLLYKYYDIKNALVSSDALRAAKSASDFMALAKVADVTALSVNEQTVFKSLQAKLITDAGSIADSKDLAVQRGIFQKLSASVITLTQASKPLKPAYIAYCPMKKAYWISAEQEIKNPYYGNAMLTCGKLTDTLK